MVPSWRDAHHHAVYPVPPYVLRKQYSRLTLAPDPCVVDIQGLKIGITSTDVLLHLGKEEISQ
jgi:DNA polymerase alpha subunit B